MIYNIEITAEAQREYEQIVSYLTNVLQSQQAAGGFADEFAHQVDLVQSNPELHALSRMPELAARGYRAFFVNNYVVLYKVLASTVVIAHIFHQSQDYAKLI